MIPMPANSRRGVSHMEYLVLLAAVLGAFYIGGRAIQGGIQGQYRRSGDTWAYLRQHDPQRTRDCIWDAKIQTWYSEKCYYYYLDGYSNPDVLKTGAGGVPNCGAPCGNELAP